MSGLDSWEDDPSAQDENLSRQAQGSLNLNNGAQGYTPRAGAPQFQPAAQSFQPGQPFQQYGSYNQQMGYQGDPNQAAYYQAQYGYNQYHQQSQMYNQHPQAYQQQQSYETPHQRQQQQQQQQPPPQAQPKGVPVIAKRPQAGGVGLPAEGGANGKSENAAPPKAKVLSIGADTAATPTPKAKVLTLGGTAPEEASSAKWDKTKEAEGDKKSAKKDAAAEAGSKAIAAKAIEKTGEAKTQGTKGSTPSSGKSSPTPAEAKAAAKREADAVLKEQAQDVDEEILEQVYGKEHVNVIFIGHVDAGKSTLGGSILYSTGMVDERTMDKLKREAKDAGRETWYLSWALDINKEERAQGKTVEVGRGFFETETRRYTILDAPGHKTYVPNMIGGASQADLGILVISARKGEYETGFERGGQTREHAILAKTQGVNQLCIVVNKMDDTTVEWSQGRFKECTEKLAAFLRGLGYSKADLTFMPVSAQLTLGIKARIPKDVCPWYDGPSLLEYLDNMKKLERKLGAPFMMPVGAKYRDLGTMIEGKVEAGVLKKGQAYVMMPNREEVTATAVYGESEEEMPQAACGEQVRLRLRGIEEEDILPGFVLCSPKRPVHCVQQFEAQIVLLELRSILSAGFNCVLHVHAAIEEVQFDALLHKLEKGTGRKSKKPPPFASKGQSVIARLRVTGGAGSVCVERFEDYPQMGRFTLRDQVRASINYSQRSPPNDLVGPNNRNREDYQAHH